MSHITLEYLKEVATSVSKHYSCDHDDVAVDVIFTLKDGVEIKAQVLTIIENEPVEELNVSMFSGRFSTDSRLTLSGILMLTSLKVALSLVSEFPDFDTYTWLGITREQIREAQIKSKKEVEYTLSFYEALKLVYEKDVIIKGSEFLAELALRKSNDEFGHLLLVNLMTGDLTNIVTSSNLINQNYKILKQ